MQMTVLQTIRLVAAFVAGVWAAFVFAFAWDAEQPVHIWTIFKLLLVGWGGVLVPRLVAVMVARSFFGNPGVQEWKPERRNR